MNRTALIFVLCSLLTISVQGQVSVLPLDSCLMWAVENSMTLRNADLEVEAARQQKASLVSKFFPNISAMGGAYHTAQPIVSVGIDDVSNAYIRDVLNTLYTQYGAPMGLDQNLSMLQNGAIVAVTAIQPVFAGGRIVTGNRLAALGVDAARLQRDVKIQEVLLQTEESYWQIVSLYSKRETVDEALTLLDTLYRDVNGLYEAGLTEKNNLLKVKLAYNEMRSNLIKIDNGIRIATMALCQSIGKKYSDSLLLTERLDSLEAPQSYWVDPEQAVGNRSEATLLDLNVKAEKLQRQLAMGNALPQIGIGAGYLYGNLPLDKYAHNAGVFATVQIPLTAWWETGHTMKQHAVKQRMAENMRDDLKEKMALQTRLAWNELTESYRQLELADESIAEAEENLRYCTEHYQAGLVSLSELMQAQTLLKQAADQKTDHAITYRIKLTHYKQLTRQQ